VVAFPPPPGYDPSNEAQLASSYFAPFGGSSSKGCHSFLSEWLEKASRLSLAEPFGSDSGRHRISSRLPFLSSSASPHRLPIPLSVSKTVTFVTRALYVTPMPRVNFLCVLFSLAIVSADLFMSEKLWPDESLPELSASLLRFDIYCVARKTPSDHLFFDGEQCEYEGEAHSG
jgi:hypothetical protein